MTTPTHGMNQTYTIVWADPGRDTDRVTIRHGDRLRAELEAGQRWPGLAGNMREMPFHWTNLWVWAAAVRSGLTDCGSREFADLVDELNPDDDDTTTDAATGEPLDPTPPGPPTVSP